MTVLGVGVGGMALVAAATSKCNTDGTTSPDSTDSENSSGGGDGLEDNNGYSEMVDTSVDASESAGPVSEIW